jgi:hypothetical protein
MPSMKLGPLSSMCAEDWSRIPHLIHLSLTLNSIRADSSWRYLTLYCRCHSLSPAASPRVNPLPQCAMNYKAITISASTDTFWVPLFDLYHSWSHGDGSVTSAAKAMRESRNMRLKPSLLSYVRLFTIGDELWRFARDCTARDAGINCSTSCDNCIESHAWVWIETFSERCFAELLELHPLHRIIRIPSSSSHATRTSRINKTTRFTFF